MHETMMTYFEGEKSAGLFLASLGAFAMVAAAILFQPRWELRPLAITLAVFALLEIGVGLGLYFRTGPQTASLLALLETDAARFFLAESTRMARVQRSFVVIQYVWLAVIVLSAPAAVALRGRFWGSGVALGLLLNASVLLAFDLIAERRGAAYLSALQLQGTPPPR